MPAYSDPEFVKFLDAMREAPGSSAHLLVAADWLDEHEQPDLAAVVRARAPMLAERYRRASTTLDALLAFDIERARPVPMPAPDNGHHRSPKQWVRLVRGALRPMSVPHLTVGAVTDRWRYGGPHIELRVPPLELGIGNGLGTGFLVPWDVSSSELIRAGTVAFAELMPRLFPDVPDCVVHFDGESSTCAFWRVTTRNR